jgi:hypothetical protein
MIRLIWFSSPDFDQHQLLFRPAAQYELACGGGTLETDHRLLLLPHIQNWNT